MKCERFQAIAAQLARKEILDADECTKALAHAEACELCAKILTLESQLTMDLRSLAQETKTARATSTVEDKVLTAFRERTRHSLTATSSRPYFWVSAVAAVLLLAVGILGWHWYVAPVPQRIEGAGSKSAPANVAVSSPERSPVLAVGTTQPPNASTPLASRRFQPPKHSTSPAAELNVAKRVATEPSLSATTHETKEITTAFVPLGYGSALDLQDGGQMVRVELPRSALARFGLPINMNRADEKIKADVLVGSDGLARAIRFVQPVAESTTGPGPQNERNEK